MEPQDVVASANGIPTRLPSSAGDHALGQFPTFVSRALSRLSQGQATYGDASFDRHPLHLVAEIEQELLDIVGWGYILWTRLQRLEQLIAARHGDGA